MLFVAGCMLRLGCCLFVVLLVGACLSLFLVFIDGCLQCAVCCSLSSAVDIFVVRCLLFVVCCDRYLLRLLCWCVLFVVWCCVWFVVRCVLLFVGWLFCVVCCWLTGCLLLADG